MADDETARHVGADDLPESIRRNIEAFDEVCPECGERKVAAAPNAAEGASRCYGCGAAFAAGTFEDAADGEGGGRIVDGSFVYDREGDGDTATALAAAKEKTGWSKGHIVQLIGLAICFTFVGAPLGIVLIYVGRKMDEE